MVQSIEKSRFIEELSRNRLDFIMQLEHLIDLKGRLAAPYLDAGRGPFGTRYIYNAADGGFEGPRLKGRFLPGGGDWPLADDNGTMRLDIRLVLETDDGAVIYFENHGVWRQLPSGGDRSGGMYIMGTPRFETGDDRYQWLNDHVFVAEGEVEMLEEEEGLLAEVTWHVYTLVAG